MGKRGRAKTPTPLLKIAGSRLVADRVDEPEPPTGHPEPPHPLSEKAQAVWHQILPQLQKMGVLTIVDGAALGRYCEMHVRWWEATAYIAEHGETYEIVNRGGSVYHQQYPQVSVAARLHTAMLRVEQEFGLTPASRAGLKVESPKKPKTDEGRFFSA